MEVTIMAGATVNVGDPGATGASELKYKIYQQPPEDPVLGMYRMMPVSIKIRGMGGKVQWYNPGDKSWVDGNITMFELALAQEINNRGLSKPNEYLYFEMVHTTAPAPTTDRARGVSFGTDFIEGQSIELTDNKE